MKRAARIVLGVLTTFVVLNALFALVCGYLLAAGADDVYHGVQLAHLASFTGGVALGGVFVVCFGWLILECP